jgi:Trypsin-co-occurring domain 2
MAIDGGGGDDSSAVELAEEIGAIVAQIKRAIIDVSNDPRESGPSLAIEKAELTLNAVVTRGKGGNLSFRIFGHSLGLSGEMRREDTQTIELALTPAEEDVMTFATEQMSENLASAIRAIRDSIAIAAADPPRFGLVGASVELNFEVDKDGDIAFVVTGEAKSTNVQTVKLTLIPA